MNVRKATALTLCAILFAAGTAGIAQAQGTPGATGGNAGVGGEPADPAAQSNMATQAAQQNQATMVMRPAMSPGDTKKMQACEAMQKEAMMANAGCKSLMAKYPGAMTPNAPMNDNPPSTPQ